MAGLLGTFNSDGSLVLVVPPTHPRYIDIAGLVARSRQAAATGASPPPVSLAWDSQPRDHGRFASTGGGDDAPAPRAAKKPHAAPPSGADDDSTDDGGHLAGLYADLWNTQGTLPDDLDEEEVADVSSELHSTGWGLNWSDADGKWSAVHRAAEDETAPIQMSAHHAPKGGVTVNGKFFRGGLFIPNGDYEQATPEEKAAIDGGRKARDDKRRGRGEVDHGKLGEILQPHANLELDKKAMTSAKRSFNALTRHHGDLVTHRLEEIAQGLHDAYQKTPAEQGDKRAQIAQRLRGVSHMLDMVKSKVQKDGEAKAPWEGGKAVPDKVYMAPTSSLHVDPERFQFKLNTDKSGVTEELKSIKTFNPDFAGTLAAWQDPADGKTYVVNGHHRHELASRVGHPNLAIRYIQAPDAKTARAVGALINIAEGRGTAVDAAKFMRDRGMGLEDMAKEGVSAKGKLAADAVILTKLNDRLFDRVARGLMDPTKAMAIAKHLHDGDLQDQLVRLMEKKEDAGKDLSPKVVEEMAREMAHTPTVSKTESSLFGDIESEESLFVERNELKSHVRSELSKEVNDFLAVASKRRADRVGKTGNILDPEANKKIAEESERVRNVFDMLVNRKGVISDAINDAAAQYASAKTKRDRDAARERAVESVRNAVFAEAGVGREPADPVGGSEARPGEPGGREPADHGRGGEDPASQSGTAAEPAAGDGGRGAPVPTGLTPEPEKKPTEATPPPNPVAPETPAPSTPSTETPPPSTPKPKPMPSAESSTKPPGILPEHLKVARKKLASGSLAIKGHATSEPVVSDLSGHTIRRHVELPSGAKIHPDELARAKVVGGQVQLDPHEGIEVSDPLNNGKAKAKSFERAVAEVAAYKGHDNDRVTLQSPHGYVVTKTRAEWRDVASGQAGKPESMASWYDRENPLVESEAAAKANQQPVAKKPPTEAETEQFFQAPEEQSKLFDWQTPGMKPSSTAKAEPWTMTQEAYHQKIAERAAELIAGDRKKYAGSAGMGRATRDATAELGGVHSESVRAAAEAGKDVPANVLSKYPQWKKPHERTQQEYDTVYDKETARSAPGGPSSQTPHPMGGTFGSVARDNDIKRAAQSPAGADRSEPARTPEHTAALKAIADLADDIDTESDGSVNAATLEKSLAQELGITRDQAKYAIDAMLENGALAKGRLGGYVKRGSGEPQVKAEQVKPAPVEKSFKPSASTTDQVGTKAAEGNGPASKPYRDGVKMGDAVKGAMQELMRFTQYEDGLMQLDRVYHTLKQHKPDLTVDDFHKVLDDLWKQGDIELKVQNELREMKPGVDIPMADHNGERNLNFATLSRRHYDPFAEQRKAKAAAKPPVKMSQAAPWSMTKSEFATRRATL